MGRIDVVADFDAFLCGLTGAPGVVGDAGSYYDKPDKRCRKIYFKRCCVLERYNEEKLDEVSEFHYYLRLRMTAYDTGALKWPYIFGSSDCRQFTRQIVVRGLLDSRCFFFNHVD